MVTVLLGLYTQPAVWNGGETAEEEGHQEKGYQGCHMQTGQMAEVRSKKGSSLNSNGQVGNHSETSSKQSTRSKNRGMRECEGCLYILA